AAKDPGFEPGDQIVAMSDAEKYPDVTPLPPDPKDTSRGQPDFNEYHRRMVLLTGQPVTFHLRRKDERDPNGLTAITVGPAYRANLGMRMSMGEVVAVRQGSPAERAGIKARPLDGPPARGDRIAQVTVTEPGGGKTRWM